MKTKVKPAKGDRKVVPLRHHDSADPLSVTLAAMLMENRNVDPQWRIWPDIAREMWRALQSSGAPHFYEGTNDDDTPNNDWWLHTCLTDVDIPWTFSSVAARVFMEHTFGLDCALYPKLWQYLLERLPILAAPQEPE